MLFTSYFPSSFGICFCVASCSYMRERNHCNYARQYSEIKVLLMPRTQANMGGMGLARHGTQVQGCNMTGYRKEWLRQC